MLGGFGFLSIWPDLIKSLEGLGRSVAVRVKSERERIFDLGGIRKKHSIRCQNSRSNIAI